MAPHTLPMVAILAVVMADTEGADKHHYYSKWAPPVPFPLWQMVAQHRVTCPRDETGRDSSAVLLGPTEGISHVPFVVHPPGDLRPQVLTNGWRQGTVT